MITGVSLRWMASISSEPMPGTRKICSVMMAPPNTAGIGQRDQRHDRDQRVAHHVLQDHHALAQALAARRGHVVEADHVEHRRAHVARPARALEQAQHRTGMIDCLTCSHHHCQPVAGDVGAETNGSQSSLIENSRISSSPVKKVGSEKPTKASVLAMRSNHEYGRAAE